MAEKAEEEGELEAEQRLIMPEGVDEQDAMRLAMKASRDQPPQAPPRHVGGHECGSVRGGGDPNERETWHNQIFFLSETRGKQILLWSEMPQGIGKWPSITHTSVQ
jgi:hypothetical protein